MSVRGPVARDPIGIVRQLVLDAGESAEGWLSRHDFGLPREVVQDHIDRVWSDLAALSRSSFPLRVPLDVRATADGGTPMWDAAGSLRYAAGAAMLTQRFRTSMAPEDAQRAHAAKILQEFLADLLDDLIDERVYTFREALRLYRHCLRPLSEGTFDRGRFASKLKPIVHPDQRASISLITEIVGGIQELLMQAPNRSFVAAELRRSHERLAFGQALTVLQKAPTRDVRELRWLASTVTAPDADLSWAERLGLAVGHVTSLTLLDLAFTRERPTTAELRSHLSAWAYYDLVIVLLNNALDVRKDLARGLVNLAVLASKGDRAVTSTAVPKDLDLTAEELQGLLSRTAEFCHRALLRARGALDDPEGFYPFITLMIPVVMFGSPDEAGADIMDAYLRELAPVVRKAYRARAVLPNVTTRRSTHSIRPGFARSASS